MKAHLATLLAFFMLLQSCDTGELKEDFAKQDYDQAKESLLKKETNNPASFIRVTGSDKRNLVGQTVVKGMLVNSASVAVYKDVDVELKFFSKTGTLLETDKETFYEILHPGETREFKTKYFAPKGTDSVALRVIGANDRRN